MTPPSSVASTAEVAPVIPVNGVSPVEGAAVSVAGTWIFYGLPSVGRGPMQVTIRRPVATPGYITKFVQPTVLRVLEGGFQDLYKLLLRANQEDRQMFEQAYARLEHVIRRALDGLMRRFGEDIQEVVLGGDEVLTGVDLRDMPYSDLGLAVVLRGEERPAGMYRRMAQEVFGDLSSDQINLQLDIFTRPRWQWLLKQQSAHGERVNLSIPLLTRE